MNSAKPTYTMTDRDRELIVCAFRSLREKPNIDYDLMATLAGLKGAKSARDSFTPLFNRIVAASGGADAAAAATPKKNGKAATPRKPGKAVEAENSSDNEQLSPTKKKKATPRKGKGKVRDAEDAASDAAADDDGDGDEVVVKSEVVDEV